MPRSTASATMFLAAFGSSFMTTIPPNAMMESLSPVLPRVRFAIKLDGVAFDAWSLVVVDAATVRALFLRNSRRSIFDLERMKDKETIHVRQPFSQIGSRGCQWERGVRNRQAKLRG